MDEHLEKYWKQYLIAILTLGFIIRLIIFIKYQGQAVWWDEADYLSLSRSWALGTPHQAPEYRAWGIAILYAPLYWLSANETVLKFLELLFSTAGIYMTFLVGKEFFNKKVGLFAALAMTTLWVHLFWTPRISMGIIGLLFFTGTAITFYKGYVKKQKKYHLLAGALIGIGIFFYESLGFILPFILIYLLVTEKLSFLKNKRFWMFVLFIIIAALPFLLTNIIQHDSLYPRLDNMFARTESSLESSTEVDWQAPISVILTGAFTYFPQLPNIMQWAFFIFLIIGLGYFINLILGFDLLLKNKSEKLKKDFYILSWPIIQLIIVGLLVSTGVGFYYEPRFAFPTLPILFSIAGNGAFFLYDKIKKHQKELAAIAILAIIIWGLVSGAMAGFKTLDAKTSSFYYEKPAGKWIRDNTPTDATILACSQTVPLTYYAERDIRGFTNGDIEAFEKQLQEKNPDYLIFDFYHYECDPSYISAKADQLEPIQIYFLDAEQTQPIILIFRVIK